MRQQLAPAYLGALSRPIRPKQTLGARPLWATPAPVLLPMRDPEGSHNRIYSVVRRTPSEHVLTYGDVAALTGLPGHARLVGYALHTLPEHTTLPWHRVISHKGALSTGGAWPGGELVQRHLLEAEGVEFDANGRTSVERCRWNPEPLSSMPASRAHAP